MGTRTLGGADTMLDSAVLSALRLGTPLEVAEDARRVTAQRFGRAALSAAHQRQRAESYFWGVIRKRALMGRAPSIASLMVAASLASELREAGHAPEAIAQAVI